MHSIFFFYLWLMKRYRISARHFRQNPHFPKGPFAISFEFLFTVWRFWRLIAISAVFDNACISGHISQTLPRFGVTRFASRRLLLRHVFLARFPGVVLPG